MSVLCCNFTCKNLNGYTFGDINDILYKGYVYDRETGLYYLQSRYYSPYLCRFISMDDPQILLETVGDIKGSDLYEYCNNNPVMYCDDNGMDAIWLQDTNAVSGAGHTGLLIQDKKGRWYHFHWGKNKSNSPLTYDRYTGRIDKYSINLFYSSNNKKNKKYEGLIRFKGDFSASYSYALGLTNKKYNVLLKNCMQVTTDILRKGTFKYNNRQYRQFLSLLRIKVVPNVAYARMLAFHNSVTAWNNSSKWKRLFLVSPSRAVWLF